MYEDRLSLLIQCSIITSADIEDQNETWDR